MEASRELEELIAKREEVNSRIQELTKAQYSKYQGGDRAVVKDDNPYSRLMALEKMGVVEDFA